MVLVFFDAKGIIYMKYAPKGTSANAEHVKKALTRFLVHFRQKRLITSPPPFHTGA
jgi:hypothetical protein